MLRRKSANHAEFSANRNQPNKNDYKSTEYRTHPDGSLHDEIGHVLEGPTAELDGRVVALLLKSGDHPIDFVLALLQIRVYEFSVEHRTAERSARNRRHQPYQE